MTSSRIILFVSLALWLTSSCKKEESKDEIFTFPDRHPVFVKKSNTGGVAAWFRSATEGVALRYGNNSSNATLIVQTNDAGATWSPVLEIPDQAPREMEFVPNSPVGYFTTWQALYRSSDYGATWEKMYDTGSQWVSIGELCVVSENIVLLGFDGKLNKSTDGGQNWQPIKTFDPNSTDNMTALWFVNENQGFIGYRYGTIERSTDGGQTWQGSDSGFQDAIAQFFFTDSQHGYASCLYRDYIVTTSDGGQTWNSGNVTGRSSGFTRLWFDQAGKGLLTARGNKVFYSTDAGKNCFLLLNAPGLNDDAGFIQATPDNTLWVGFSNSLYQVTFHL